MRFFASGFFHESVSPQPQSIPLRPFRIFSKILGDIRGSRFATGVNDRWQMDKIFNQKNFNNFVWSPLGSRGNIHINFCLQVYFQVSAAWYCSHYLPPVSMTTVANLPPLSLIPVAICPRRRWHRRQICRRYRWHWWHICHWCQQHKGNWWQNLPPESLIPVANFPPVSLIPAAICHRCRWSSTPHAFTRELSKSSWNRALHGWFKGSNPTNGDDDVDAI